MSLPWNIAPTGICPENRGGHSLPPGTFRMYRVEKVRNLNYFLFYLSPGSVRVGREVWVIHRICPQHNTNGFTNDHVGLLPHQKFYGIDPFALSFAQRNELYAIYGPPSTSWPSCVWYGLDKKHAWSFLQALGAKTVRKISQDKYEASALIERNQVPIKF